jgi:flagellar hook-associated protein 1 FlgK
MSNVFGISVSALNAFQTAISVVSNNIANANTAGYADETPELTSAVPTSAGNASIGGGVEVAGITRAFNQLNENQLNSSQSSLGSLDSQQSYTNQIDNIVGTTAGGLSTSLTSYYSAWSTLANDPTSTASRQALLNQAQGVASSLSSTNSQLQSLNTGINQGITQDVAQINSLSASISSLNQQIVAGTANAGGQAPNSLIDQRGVLVSNMSKLIGVSTTTDANGALNVFVGSGQPLVLQGTTTQLTTVPNQFNASQLEISTSTSNNNVISGTITSGDLGGLLAARTQNVNPAINQLGQIATALAVSANSQQKAGLDLTGQQGANLFSVAAPTVSASSANGTTATVTTPTSATIGALSANSYILSYKGGAYSLTNTTDGTSLPATNTGTTTPTFTVDGLTVALSKTPAAGDQFLIQPTANAAGSFSVALTSSSGLAAAGAVVASAGTGSGATAIDTNVGSATISSGTVVDPTNTNLLATTTIMFTSPTAYSVTVGGTLVSSNNAYTSGGTIGGAAAPASPANGWQVQITGTPATGDTFTVQSNAGGTGDNRNALASANLQTKSVLTNGTISVNGAVSAMVTNIGSQAQQINTAQTAQTSINTQALATVQSVSGVNLDEEAANLLQWQQAYQASAQALQIANTTFASLLAAVNTA